MAEASPSAGFTLLEALIAFAITALALSAVLPMVLDAAAGAERAAATRLAVLYAESKLATIGREQPLAAGEASGSFDTRYRWTAHIAPAGLAPAGRRPEFESYDIMVRVTWGEAGNPRSVTLRTLRIGPIRQADR